MSFSDLSLGILVLENFDLVILVMENTELIWRDFMVFMVVSCRLDRG
jgi:hypothetical protein